MLNRLSPTSALGAATEGRGLELWEIISFAWRKWKLIASIAAATLLVGAINVLKETPYYTASADILLEPRKDRAPGESNISDVTIDYAVVESQMAVIRSSVFLRRVVEKERLYSDPEFGSVPVPARRNPSILEKIRSVFFIFGAPPAPPEAKPQTPEPDNTVSEARIIAAVNALKGAISVTRGVQLYILSISVTSVDPTRAARLANAVADGYVVEKLDARFDAAKRASAWLSDRLGELRMQLRQSEEAVAQFRSEHGFVQSGANVTLTQQQLAELNAKLVATRAETVEKKARVDLLESILAKGGNVQSLPDLASTSSTLMGLRGQLAAVSQREADLVARYSDRHPLVVNVRAERRDVERAIVAETKQLIEKIKNEYELAKTREAAIDQSLREVTGQTGIDDKTAITLRELERTAAVNKSLFEDFLQKAKITQEQATFEARDARVITPALPPGGPSSPQKFRFMLTSLIIGLILGTGGALAIEKLNTGFTTPPQVEQVLELPLLASVYRLDKGDRTVNNKLHSIPLCPILMPLSRFSEAMRTLRNGIQMTDVDRPPKVIQVTSTLPDEGKTTIALSLAASAATSGLKVLFIDADMRHPSASHFFGMHKERGLVDLLLENPNPQEMFKYNAETKFWILTSGSETQNPTDLLSSDRMKSLIDVCRNLFDYVVIDTPPVGPVSDPLIVSRHVDKTVYVVHWARTAREMVKYSIQQFSGHKQIAGIVFNFVNEGEARKYGKHAFPYYYMNTYKKYYDR
jgi:polysaccharide biosynthesis transport protein